MTTKISFTVTDEIAEQMNTKTPDIYFDVFGNVMLRLTSEYDIERVGQWWRG